MRLQLRERITSLSMDLVVRDAIRLTYPTRRGRNRSFVWGIWSALQIARQSTGGPVTPIDALDEDRAGPGRCRRVLVVDDEPMVADMYKIVLESSGHRVTTVPDAAKLLSVLMEQDLDLAVVDLALPGVDGWEVCRRINRIYPDIPVIVASGIPVSVEAVAEQGACVSAILNKPFDMQQLLDAIFVATDNSKEAVASGARSNGELMIME